MPASIVLKFTEAFVEDMVSLSISYILPSKYQNKMNTPYGTSSQIIAE